MVQVDSAFIIYAVLQRGQTCGSFGGYMHLEKQCENCCRFRSETTTSCNLHMEEMKCYS